MGQVSSSVIPELNSSLESSVKVESIQNEAFLVGFCREVLLPGMDLDWILDWKRMEYIFCMEIIMQLNAQHLTLYMSTALVAIASIWQSSATDTDVIVSSFK